MLTVSCYTLHPLAQRVVRLWKRVQVVSDWLVVVLSCFCCQCAQLMPYDETSDNSDELPPAAPKSPDSDRLNAGSGEPRAQVVMDIPEFREGRGSPLGRDSHKLNPIQNLMEPNLNQHSRMSQPVPVHVNPQRLGNQSNSTTI